MTDQKLSFNDPKEHVAKLSKIFVEFVEPVKDSQIYATLSRQIANDEDLLLKIPIVKSQPVPNLFLAAVNYLLFKYPDEELANHYPNHSKKPASGDLFAVFKKFCFDHLDEIKKTMASHLVQTNEVRRCALLLPAVAYVSSQSGSPVHLIDVGTSSGLNLLMDRYRILYSDGSVLGDKSSPLELQCELKGLSLSRLPEAKIADRVGIDLNPIDLNDEKEFLWALSLIWPDQLERFDRFKKAVSILSKNPVTLKKGSALDLILPTISSLPKGSHACVMHSFALYQFTKEERKQFDEQLKQASMHCPVWRISMEWLSGECPEMLLDNYSGGQKLSSAKLAEGHAHGAWLNWLVKN